MKVSPVNEFSSSCNEQCFTIRPFFLSLSLSHHHHRPIIFVSFLLRDYSKKKLKISFSSQHHILYRKDTIFYPDACVFRRENYISRWIRALKLVSLSAFLFTLETLNASMFYLWSPQKLKVLHTKSSRKISKYIAIYHLIIIQYN